MGWSLWFVFGFSCGFREGERSQKEEGRRMLRIETEHWHGIGTHRKWGEGWLEWACHIGNRNTSYLIFFVWQYLDCPRRLRIMMFCLYLTSYKSFLPPVSNTCYSLLDAAGELLKAVRAFFPSYWSTSRTAQLKILLIYKGRMARYNM